MRVAIYFVYIYLRLLLSNVCLVGYNQHCKATLDNYLLPDFNSNITSYCLFEYHLTSLASLACYFRQIGDTVIIYQYKKLS